MKKVFKFLTVFIALIVAFNILLLLGSLFPSKLIENNVKESSKILLIEGNIYKFFDAYYAVNDNYTDSLMINEAYSIDNTTPVLSYMAARKNYKSGVTTKHLTDNLGEAVSVHTTSKYEPIEELQEFLNGNITTSMSYARYWHGYLPFLRVLLLFFNISEIRIVLLITFVILFVYLIYLLNRKLGTKISLIFAITLIIEDYFFVSYSLECAPIFILMTISCIILLNKIDKIKDWYIFIFVVACITNFVDYLTVPLITLAMPLYIYILYNQKHNNQLTWKYYLTLIIKSSITWFLGYSLTWISKWVIYDSLYNEGLINSAISQVLYRIERTNSLEKNTIWQTIYNLLSNKIIPLITILIMLPFGLAIYKIECKVTIKLKRFKEYLQDIFPLLIISLMPFVWYIALANHTIIHNFFVYRHLLIFFTGILLCIYNLFIIQKEEKSIHK